MREFRYGITMSDVSSPTAPIVFNGSYEKSISSAARIGYDAAEFHVRNPLDVPYEYIIKTCEDEGVAVAALATGWSFVSEGLSFIDDDPAIRQRAVTRFKEYIDLAAHLKSMVIVGLMRGRIDDLTKYDKYLVRFNTAFEQLIDYAACAGVVLVLEAINRFQTNYINNLYETAELLEAFDGAPVGLHIDTFHMNIEDRDLTKTIKDCRDLIRYVHYSDSNRLIPGAGNINFIEITKCLHEINYDGIITIESLPRPSSVEAAEHGLKYVKVIEWLLNQQYIMEKVK